jgi:hypothetical protein
MVGDLKHLSYFTGADCSRFRRNRMDGPQTRHGPMMHGFAIAGLGVAALALAGCSSTLDRVYTGSFWAQPGKYDFLKCPDLAQRSLSQSTREKELVSLMERASQDAAGPLVNAMVYSADLHQVRADLDVLQQTAREKGCTSLVPTK